MSAATGLGVFGAPRSSWTPFYARGRELSNWDTQHGPLALPQLRYGVFTKSVGGGKNYTQQFTALIAQATPGKPLASTGDRVGTSGRVGVAATDFTRHSPTALPGQLWGPFPARTAVSFETDIPGRIITLMAFGGLSITQDTTQITVDVPALTLSTFSTLAPTIFNDQQNVEAFIPLGDITPVIGGGPTVHAEDIQPQFIPLGVLPLMTIAPDVHQRIDRHHWQEEEKHTDTWTRRTKASDAWTKKPKRT